MLNGIEHARILIVDDEPANVELVRQTLSHQGYLNIRTASDPREVLGIYKDFEPDILLLDLRMPYMDGFAVMDQLKANDPNFNMPILVLTAEHNSETCLKALNNGGKDFMGKPINLLEMLTRVKNLLESHLLQKKVLNQNLILEEKVKERTEELKTTRLSVIQRLGRAAEYRDNETGFHVIRMSRYSALLGKKIGLDNEKCDLILNASPMHDIGKIGIPDSILLKPGKLDHDEWKIMKTHTTIGAQILADDKSELLQFAQKIALQHHEKFDGTGYPNSLKGEEISLETRIVTTCDIFDALTSERPYKKSWSIEEAINEMEKIGGSILDHKLVASFKEILPDILEIKGKFQDESA